MNDTEKQALQSIINRTYATGEAKGYHAERHFRATIEQAVRDLRDPHDAGPETGNSVYVDGTPASIRAVVLDAERRTRTANGVDVMAKLMLVCTETAEAAEAFRRHKRFPDPQQCYAIVAGTAVPYDQAPPGAKPEGVGSELADVILRVLDLGMDAGIDLVAEMERKMAFNDVRPTLAEAGQQI